MRMTPETDPERRNLYLLGVGVMHSIAPKMHEYLASSLGLDWKFANLECPSMEHVASVIESPTTAGAVITMPYKQSIIPHLSTTTPCAQAIGAVNNVYLDDERRLHGTNTDWEGIKGCLLSADPSGRGRGKPALVVGAGGACRAAIYALQLDFAVETVLVVNRDKAEVDALKSDVERYTAGRLELVHLESIEQAHGVRQPPFYVIGTIPDYEPETTSEKEMRGILEVVLNGAKGVLLDMCYKPRNTRLMKMGRKSGWECVSGTSVIGYQVASQWSCWLGRRLAGVLPEHEARRILDEQAELSTAINF